MLLNWSQVYESGDAMLARVYARRGVPISLRNHIWTLLMNINVVDSKLYFNQVCQQSPSQSINPFQLLEDVLKHELLIDQIYMHDLKDTCNDDIYFVFEVA